MSEGEPTKKIEKKKPTYVGGSTKPKSREGIRWVAVKGDSWKRSRITGWRAVSTEPSMGPPDELDNLSKKRPFDGMGGSVVPGQLEESRKKAGWVAGIEKSQPFGDKD